VEGKLGQITRFDSIHFALQEIFVNLDSVILIRLLNIAKKVLILMDDKEGSVKSIKQEISDETSRMCRHQLCP
jgi:hypothetical protein